MMRSIALFILAALMFGCATSKPEGRAPASSNNPSDVFCQHGEWGYQYDGSDAFCCYKNNYCGTGKSLGIVHNSDGSTTYKGKKAPDACPFGAGTRSKSCTTSDGQAGMTANGECNPVQHGDGSNTNGGAGSVY